MGLQGRSRVWPLHECQALGALAQRCWPFQYLDVEVRLLASSNNLSHASSKIYPHCKVNLPHNLNILNMFPLCHLPFTLTIIMLTFQPKRRCKLIFQSASAAPIERYPSSVGNVFLFTFIYIYLYSLYRFSYILNILFSTFAGSTITAAHASCIASLQQFLRT